VNIQPAEIQELLATVREVLREHRRMALYVEVYTTQHPRWGMMQHPAAMEAVLAFDNMFKEPT
jgi:hypothetical protein